MHALRPFKHILFFDVETVSSYATYEDLDERGQALWLKKTSQLYRADPDIQPEVSYKQKAGIFAEFAKAVCISVGYLAETKDAQWEFRLKSFFNTDESILLQEFAAILRSYYNDVSIHSLCGHNIREFDIPFLSRRMLVNQIKFPVIMDIRYAKPWEREHLIDTLQDWKFGDYKNYTSLDSLCHVFNVPSPKNTMSGGDVHATYYEDGDLLKIAKYCEDDVVATMRVFLRLQNIYVSEDEIAIKSVTQ